MTNKYKVYFLTDPQSLEIKYIGITSQSIKSRLSEHLYISKSGTHHNANWIKKLARRGLKPSIQILQSFINEKDCIDAEQYWISYFKSVGCKLTNICTRGAGTLHTSEETRRKISEKAKARMTPEYRRNISEKLKGKVFWNIGRKHKPESILKMKAAHKGWKMSEEQRQKMIIILNKCRVDTTGYKHTEEAKQKMSEYRKGRPLAKNNKPVLDKEGFIWPSVTMAARFFGLDVSYINKQIKHKHKNKHGYSFSFLLEA